jgi:hypothetical protein
VHKLNLKKSVILQSNIFRVDTFEFDEVQIKENASQESNCSALSIEDWDEQEPGDDELASHNQLEQLLETNGKSMTLLGYVRTIYYFPMFFRVLN